MNVDQPDTTTTCEVCLDGDGPWIRAELGLGARSMLIQPIEGEAGAVWVPYVDIRQLDEVDRSPTAAPGVRHLEIGLRDGRRPQVVLESSVVDGLLAALAAAQSVPDQAPPRPAEFDIGGPPPTLAPAAAPTPPPPVDASAPNASPFSPLDRPPLSEQAPAAPPPSAVFPASPSPENDATATKGPGPDDAGSSSSSSRRNALIIGGALLALIALVVLAFVVFAGGDSDDAAAPDAASPASTTAAPTTTPAAPSEPSDVLSVTALDVTPVTSDEGRSLYIDFEVRNLGDDDIAAYDLLVTVSVDRASLTTATFELDCATTPLPAGSSRQGQYRPDDAEANREQFSNCTVGGWPVDPSDPAQVALGEALVAGEVAQTDVQLRSVTLADGTTLT